MNMIVASIVFVILLTVALAHLLWSVGSRWPIKDPELLARFDAPPQPEPTEPVETTPGAQTPPPVTPETPL